MLDHIERWTLLVNPARKGPGPVAVGALHIELDESTGQSLGFPWCGGIASAKPDQRIFGADRLTGLQREIADDSVAFVKQGDHRHSVGHRRDAGGVDRRRQRFGNDLIVNCRVVYDRVAASENQPQESASDDPTAIHAWSGVQAL